MQLTTLFSLTLSLTCSLGAVLIVPNSNCTTVTEGALVLNTKNSSLESTRFILTSYTNLQYVPLSPDPMTLQVQFQTCTPNFGGWTNSGDGPLAGHLYAPSLDKCLGIQSPQSDPPYAVVTLDCDTVDDSSQIFINWVKNDQGIFWAGLTNAKGTLIQSPSTCPGSGLFGFNSESPDPLGDVKLTCQSSNATVGFAVST